MKLIKNIENKKDVFSGMYCCHRNWDEPYFSISFKKDILGLFPNFERWLLLFDNLEKSPFAGAEIGKSKFHKKFYKMTFEGIPGAKGKYGKRGLLTRRAMVLKILECKKIKIGEQSLIDRVSSVSYYHYD